MSWPYSQKPLKTCQDFQETGKKITCGTRDEAKKLGDWKGLPETKTYAQKPLPDRIITEIDGS